MKEAIHISELGSFKYGSVEVDDEIYQWYEGAIPVDSGKTITVIIYPENHVVSEEYERWILRAISSCCASQASALNEVYDELGTLFSEYELGELPDLSALQNQLDLDQINIPVEGVELRFHSGTLFPNFNLSMYFDTNGSLIELAFDG